MSRATKSTTANDLERLREALLRSGKITDDLDIRLHEGNSTYGYAWRVFTHVAANHYTPDLHQVMEVHGTRSDFHTHVNSVIAALEF